MDDVTRSIQNKKAAMANNLNSQFKQDPAPAPVVPAEIEKVDAPEVTEATTEDIINPPQED